MGILGGGCGVSLCLVGGHVKVIFDDAETSQARLYVYVVCVCV